MTTEGATAAFGSSVPVHQRAERLGHALYGLIIVTATLVAEKGHVTEVIDALGLLLGTALVLLFPYLQRRDGGTCC